MKLPKQKKCKNCQKMFTPYTSLTKVCSVQCALQYNIDHPKEVKTFIQLQEEKGIKAEIKKFKANLKNHAYWIKLLQATFNTYIRERDKNKPCICCNKLVIFLLLAPFLAFELMKIIALRKEKIATCINTVILENTLLISLNELDKKNLKLFTIEENKY